MTRVDVVDASAVAAVVFNEEGGETVSPGLTGGGKVIAPRLLSYEMASITVSKTRRRPAEAERFLRGFADFQGMEIELYEVDHSAVIELALRNDLTGCDASYLWLALDRKAGLVTLDRQLARAASRAGLR